MDIAEVSMALANASVLSQVGTAGIVQIMDAAAMELSVNPNVGANFDIRV